MEIKDTIKNRRLELGFTLKQIAEAVGVTEATVSRWESGDIANMRRDRIYALAKKLNLSPVKLMGLDVPKDNIKEFTDAISTMTEEERSQLYDYMLFIISKRK